MRCLVGAWSLAMTPGNTEASLKAENTKESAGLPPRKALSKSHDLVFKAQPASFQSLFECISAIFGASATEFITSYPFKFLKHPLEGCFNITMLI